MNDTVIEKLTHAIRKADRRYEDNKFTGTKAYAAPSAAPGCILSGGQLNECVKAT
jgi:hypothetical protein